MPALASSVNGPVPGTDLVTTGIASSTEPRATEHEYEVAHAGRRVTTIGC